MSKDELGITDDFADVVGEDSNLGGSILSASHNPAPNKAPTKPTSSAGGSGIGSISQTPSARPSTAGSRGRPSSPLLGATASDDFADILGSNAESSSASLGAQKPPLADPARSGSEFRDPVGAAASRPPSAVATAAAPGRLSPAGGAPAMSQPESLSGSGAGPFVAMSGSQSGFSSLGSTLAPPEASASPRAPQTTTQRTATFAPDTAGAHSPLSDTPRFDTSRLAQVECHIPTPFQLFRLYDADFNGRVTHEEFFSMMRDLDGLPLHYAPHDDPEHRLIDLRGKRQRLEAQRAVREEKLSLAELHRQATEEMKREMAAEVAKLGAEVSELDARIAEEEAEAKRLVHHLDESQRVTADLRQHRAQWRAFVQEEFKRADLGGSGILSIDEFYMYFYSKLCFRFPVMRTGVNPGALLFNIFVRYCSIGRGAVGGRNEDMLGHQFAKLCRDAGLINGKTFTRAHVDIVYHRSRAADESLEAFKHKAGVAATARMYYPQFLFALDKIAEKRRSGFQEVVARVLASIDTLPAPTFADFVIISGSELGPGAKVPEFLTRHNLLPDNSRELRGLADNDMIRRMKEESQDALNLTMGLAPKRTDDEGLKAFLESKRAGAGAGGTGGGDNPQQQTAAATAASPTAAATADGGGGSGGGGSSGGRAAALNASVYGSLPPLSLATDMLRQKKWERPEPSELERSRATAVSRGVTPMLSPNTMHLVRGMDPDQLMVSLKRAYEAYAAWGGGVDRAAMDRRRFSKALRDAMLVSESGPLSTRKVEAVYDKVLPASSKAFNFIQFIEALRHVALHHRLSLNEVMEKLVAVGGPRPGP